MAAANPSSSTGIPQPYHIILAGAHDAGKTTIFNTLVAEFLDSYKFKAEDKKVQSVVSFRHKYMDRSSEIKLWLHDTAGMEKKGGVVSMTRSYFRQAIGVILVYDTRNLESLYKIKDWVKAAEETCDYAQHLVYALWGNEKGSLFSSVDNPIEEYHLKGLLGQLEGTLAKPIQIEDQLVCRLNGIDQTDVANNYETLVRTIHNNVKKIDTVMKEASQKIILNPNVEGNLLGDDQDIEQPTQNRCLQIC